MRAIIEALPVLVQAIIITDPLPSIIEGAWEEISEQIKDRTLSFDELDYDGSVHEVIDSRATELLHSEKEFRSYLYFHGDEGLKALSSAFGNTNDEDWPNGSLVAGAYQLIKEGLWMRDDEFSLSESSESE